MSIDLNCNIGLTDSKLARLLRTFKSILTSHLLSTLMLQLDVQVLDLSNTSITDKLMLELMDLCPNLATLNISGTIPSEK